MAVRSHCEDEESKDTHCYESIQPVETRRKQKKQAGWVEEDDNENNYEVLAEVLVVGNNGPEENDESDYVNET